jgi:hypothetical protein
MSQQSPRPPAHEGINLEGVILSEEAITLSFLKQEKSILDDLQQQLQVEVPEPIQSFLGRLALLYGVPFGNLVADARMLPPESIRFFYLDSNWLEALIDGAFSIGVHSERDIRYHKVMQYAIRSATAEAAGTLRASLLEDDSDGQQKIQPSDVESGANVRAGFLMRSAVISGWPGVEICGYASPQEDEEHKLKLLRLDRLAPDVLLCIFEAIPERIVINEPAEDFHFGINGSMRKTVQLRDPESGVRLDQQVVAPFHSEPGSAARVLDVRALHTAINNAQTITGTSANFAVQLIDAADKQAFRLPQFSLGFSLDDQHLSTSRQPLPDLLRQRFTTARIDLSLGARISKLENDNKWIVEDAQDSYEILPEGDEFYVYRRSGLSQGGGA